MTAYIVDTETTDVDDPEVIELAVGKVDAVDVFETFVGRFKPTGEIAPGALATHHILPTDLEKEPPSALAKAHLPTDMQYMIGHNIDFDWKALGQPACKRICTLAISRALFPDGKGHTLGAMMYRLCDPFLWGDVRSQLAKAHSAWADVRSCRRVLGKLMKLPQLAHIQNYEDLWQFSEECRIPKIWSFGKYKGLPVEGTDRGYLSWCLRQPDMDEYVKLACSREMARR